MRKLVLIFFFFSSVCLADTSPYHFTTMSTCGKILNSTFGFAQKPAQLLGLPSLFNRLAKSIEQSKVAQKLAIQIDKHLASRTMHTQTLGAMERIPGEDELAFHFANMIRELPELDFYHLGRLDAEEIIDDMDAFLSNIPPQYHLQRDYTGPVVGLKYGYFKNVSHESNTGPSAVVAFAPTQHLNDWAANLSLGIDQILHPEIQRLTHHLLNEAGNIDRLMIVGHSLGGGLAQGFAYKLQKALLEAGLTTKLKLKVVTFNAFGGKEQIEWAEEGFHPHIANGFSGTHYFIKGDPVTPLGTHVGASDSLLADVNQAAPLSTTASFSAIDDTYGGWKVHGVDSLSQAFMRSKDPSDNLNTMYDQPFVIRNPRPLAEAARPVISAFRSMILQDRSIDVARDLVKFRSQYLRELNARSYASGSWVYSNWLEDEILDLWNYFDANGMDDGMSILYPVVKEYP